ncbi:MAG: inositol monophosphatase [Ideonella sp. MAG2]|nr:MAG: inositol monophosphatase [Ideonella sp. MAG2]
MNAQSTTDRWRGYLACAASAAQRGGAVIREGARRRADLVIEHKRLNDLVSEIDRQSEIAIIEEIRQRFPAHAILAEEGQGDPAATQAEVQWIVDPLDGTTNFLHGFEHFAVSIGVQERGELVAAVVLDPMRQELFEAVRGGGAFCNGAPLKVASRQGLAEALVSTGLPYPSATDAPQYFRILDGIWRGCRNVRRPGAAALDLAYVAAGRLDGFFEFALLPWDIAAGALLVTEAGGRVSDLHGLPDFLPHGYIAAGSPSVHADILAVVAQATPGPAWYGASC